MHHLTLSGSASAHDKAYRGMQFMLGRTDGKLLKERDPRKRERLFNRRVQLRERLARYVAAKQ